MSLWDALEDYEHARMNVYSEFGKLIIKAAKLIIDYKWARILAIVVIGAVILWNYASQPPEINLYDAVMNDIETELKIKPADIVWTDVIYPFNSDSYKEFKKITEEKGKTSQVVEEMFSKNLKLLTVQPMDDTNFWVSNKQSVTIIGKYKNRDVKIMIRYLGDVDILYVGNNKSELKSYKMK